MEASRAFRDDGLNRAIALQTYGDALALKGDYEKAAEYFDLAASFAATAIGADCLRQKAAEARGMTQTPGEAS